jgi:hypothetical protein
LIFSSYLPFCSNCPLLFYSFLFQFLCSLTLFISYLSLFIFLLLILPFVFVSSLFVLDFSISSCYTFLCVYPVSFSSLYSPFCFQSHFLFLLFFNLHSFILYSTGFIEDTNIGNIVLRPAYTKTYFINLCLIYANYIFLFYGLKIKKMYKL